MACYLRFVSLVVLFAYSVCVGQAQLAKTFWPRFLGGNTNSNYTAASGTLPVLKGQYFTGESNDGGSMTIGVDGRIYVVVNAGTYNYVGAPSEEELVAIDPRSGTSSIVGSIPPAGVEVIGSVPTVDRDGNLIIETIKGVCSINHLSGATNWSISLPEPSGPFSGNKNSSVAIEPDGKIIAVGLAGSAYAIDDVSGHILWTSANVGGGLTVSPAIGGDGTIYVIDFHGLVSALDPVNGFIKWQRSGGDDNFGPLVIGPNGTIYARDFEGYVYAFDPAGNLLWSDTYALVPLAASGASVGTDGTLYVYGSYGVAAFDGSDGTLVWYNEIPVGSGVAIIGSVLIDSGGTLFAMDDNGQIFAVDSKSGRLIWSCKLQGSSNWDGFAPIMTPDGSLYVPITDGTSSTPGVSVLDTFENATLSLSSSSVLSGLETTGTVTLPGVALSDVTVTLASQNARYVGVPLSVTIATGSSSATFPVTTKAYSTSYTVSVQATWDGVTKKARLTAAGDEIAGLSVIPNPVLGGSFTTGTITLTSPAPAGGWHVKLTWARSFVSIPASVTVPAGSSSATFQISTRPSYRTYGSIIGASDPLNRKLTTLTVLDDSVASVSLSPNSVIGGSSSTGIVTLKFPAPDGGYTVNLSTGNPKFVAVSATVTVEAGSKTATFAVTTKSYPVTYSTTVSASDLLSCKGATITVRS